MAAYVDTSVLMAAMFQENSAIQAQQLLRSGDMLICSWLTRVEVRRNVARLNRISISNIARQRFLHQFNEMLTVVIDESDWNLASEIAESTLIKSLDSLHLAIARNLGLKNLSFLTFDKKQASVARQMGFSVVGA
jgi:predicted nucleic acid-binding protein